MRVEHAALGRVQRAHGAQRRLQGQGLRGVQAGDALHAIGFGACGQRIERCQFAVLRGHDELAALVVGDMVAVEKLVQQAPAFHAEARLQRARRVVQAGVDHLGVARGDARAHAALALQHGHAKALARQRIATRQAHRTGPHHDCVKVGAHGHSINDCGGFTGVSGGTQGQGHGPWTDGASGLFERPAPQGCLRTSGRPCAD
jgi:hypothetical protein